MRLLSATTRRLPPLLLLGVAAGSPAGTPTTQLLACCDALHAEDCPNVIEAIGPGSAATPSGRGGVVHGLWTLTCEDGAAFFPAATRSAPSLDDGRVLSLLDPAAAACFTASCSLPPGLCVANDPTGPLVVDCATGGPAGAASWSSAQLAARSPVIVGSQAVGVRIRPPEDPPKTRAVAGSPWVTSDAAPVATAAPPSRPPAPQPAASPRPEPVAAPRPEPVAATRAPQPAAAARPEPVAATRAPQPAAAARPEPVAPRPPDPAPALQPAASPVAAVSVRPASFSRAPSAASMASVAAFQLPPTAPDPCVPDPHLRDASLEQSDLGDEAILANDPGAALGHWRAALLVNPCNAHAWTSIGSTLQDLDRADDGELALEVAARLMPGNPRAWSELGRARETLGRWSDAISAYHEALALHAGFEPAEEGLRRASHHDDPP